MITKIQDGAKLFIDEKPMVLQHKNKKNAKNRDIEMSKKTSNTGDAKQKRES